MYWIEESDNLLELVTLNDDQLLDNIVYMEKKYEFLYCRELRKLEKLKAETIIKDLDAFQEAQKKYHYLKSMSPEIWFENWDTYKSVLNEAKKRNLEIPEHENHTQKMLCFG